MKDRYHRKISALFIAGVMAVSVFTAGCGSGRDVSREKEYREQGIEQMESGSYAKALSSFDHALENAGRKYADLELDISYYKALAEYKTGDSAAAVKTCRTMLDYNEDNFRPYYLRGCIYAAGGNTKRAKTEFDKAVSNDASDYALYRNIYYAFLDSGDETDAERYLKLALKAGGNEADDQAEKGYIAYLLGDTDRASSYLKRAQSGGSDTAYLYQGVIASRSGEEKSAAGYFDRYYQKNKNDAEKVMKLAQTALNAGSGEAAEGYFKEAGDLADSSAAKQKAAKGRISAYEHSGDYEEALTLLKSYRKSYPDDTAAGKEQAFIETRLDSGSAASAAAESGSGDSGQAAAQDESETGSSTSE